MIGMSDSFRDDPEWKEIAMIIDDIKNYNTRVPYNVDDEEEEIIEEL